MRATTQLLLFAICIIGPAAAANDWVQLFNGSSLEGWKAAEHANTWKVTAGCLVADGPRSHLFYTGPVGNHDFRNFELDVEAQAANSANSGVYFHTAWQEDGWPSKGYEVQINNTYLGHGKYRELKRTGSLYGVRNVTKSAIGDDEWFSMRIRVTGNRVRIHVNGQLTVDYLQPPTPTRSGQRGGRLLSSGTIALQGHDPKSIARFRKVAIRPLPDDADPADPPRASAAGYGATPEHIAAIAARNIPFIDYHIHLRGGMTVDKAVTRQAVTGINCGVLRNIGAGWPIETDEQLAAFLDGSTGRPVFVGLQVNDRDWHRKHSAELLARLDFVLGDTMIMPMPGDDDPPVKLFKPEQFTIDDPEAWMQRYLRHNLRVLAEPINVLANPTWLPKPVEHLYDELWTDERMKSIIEAAIANHVALEINAGSGYPRDRFIRMAKSMGAKFSFGSNNFDDKPIDMSRCFEAIETYQLGKNDFHVPQPKP